MTTDLETSTYVQPNIDFDIQDQDINIKMDYIKALNTGGLNGVTEKVVSFVVDGTLGSAGSFVLDLANGAFKLR